MVFPLLGLIATGAAIAGEPYLRNRRDEIRGRWMDEGLDARGIDRNDPNAMMQGLLSMGAMSGQDVQAQLQAAEQMELDRQQRTLSSQIAAGPRYAQVALNERMYEEGLARQEEQTAMLTDYYETQMNGNGVQARLMAGMDTFNNRYATNLADSMFAPDPRNEVMKQFLNEAQPIADSMQAIEAIIAEGGLLDKVSFDAGAFSSQESIDNTNYINSILFQAEMAYKRRHYGDTEPPPAVLERIESMFGQVEPSVFRDERYRETIRANLRRALQELRLDYDTAERNAGFGGVFFDQRISGRSGLPPGWSMAN